MRFATLRRDLSAAPDHQDTVAARIEDGHAIVLDQFASVASILEAGALDRAATLDGPRLSLDQVRFAPVIPRPGKIICVGMNYHAHIEEMGRPLPAHPALFPKWPESLIGAGEPILLPPESTQVDWEGEMAVIVGKRLRRASPREATGAISGYAIMCDTSMRDWQYRSSQWLQGKTWERSTPLGPWLATPEELTPDADLITRVDGSEVQRARISDQVLAPAGLVSYISTFISLQPGDVIATGTPAGVGHASDPPRYLRPGQKVEITITGLGTLCSIVEQERVCAQ
ncbi:MAG: fumarylacetoacetate hydrolase family protein [Bifidobacteriaceae bacterium]|jgi:acylpyruvate hydrolase|nr:fumarylacetoacetate hydrolase family protein [Bifidobacteriaceae bacterium]